MSLLVHLYYTGKDGAARRFAKEMTDSGIIEQIRAEIGNLRYEYYYPADSAETVLLIDEWSEQAALDAHHKSEIMQRIAVLLEKYKLKMRVKRYISEKRKQYGD